MSLSLYPRVKRHSFTPTKSWCHVPCFGKCRRIIYFYFFPRGLLRSKAVTILMIFCRQSATFCCIAKWGRQSIAPEVREVTRRYFKPGSSGERQVTYFFPHATILPQAFFSYSEQCYFWKLQFLASCFSFTTFLTFLRVSCGTGNQRQFDASILMSADIVHF